MNRGAISVIYLALSAVVLIGLYGVYKPQVNAAAGNTFSHVEKFVGSANWNTGESSKKQKVTYPSTDLLGLPIQKGSAHHTPNGIEGEFNNPILISSPESDTHLDAGDCGHSKLYTSDVYGLMRQVMSNVLKGDRGNSVRNGHTQILLIKEPNGYAIDTGRLEYDNSKGKYKDPHYASSYYADNAQGKTIAVMTWTESNPYSIIK